LSSTAENYLGTAISRISKSLHLSEILAGVTLLAFSNGASDIITSFTAGGNDEEGMALVIGSVFVKRTLF
jgi:Ca2+/Na+ antiporter